MAQVFRALRALLAFTILTGIAYPLVFTLGAQAVFPRQADGSLIEGSGEVVGSDLIGQSWEGEQWFYGRPSGVDYDAAASAGVNLGPTSKVLFEQFTESAQAIADLEDAYREEVSVADIPVDLLTSSGSGLDPHISVAAALFQAPRIAEVRGLPLDRVEALIEAHTESKTLGVWGLERVNVLRLNLALEDLTPT